MKRTLRPLAFLPPLVLAASLAQARDRPLSHIDASYQGAGTAARPSKAASARRAAAARGAVVSAVDAKRGVPSFVWAAKGASATRAGGPTPELAAKTYLERFAPLYEMSARDASSAHVVSVHDTGAGAIVVTMRQRVGDIEIYRSDVKMLLTRDLDLFAISGSPRAASGGAEAIAKKGGGFRLSPEAALASASSDMYGLSVGAESFADAGRSKGAYRYYEVRASSFGPSASLRTSPRVKRVYFQAGERLVPAYYLELSSHDGAEGADDAYGYVVAADDGRVLYRSNLIAHEAFTYKVFAHDDQARHYPPADGPLAEHTPFPAGASPGTFRPDFVAPLDVPQEGFNKNGDPWLSASAAFTSGNNVDAYADHDEIPAAGGNPAQNSGNDPDDDPTPDPTAEVVGARTFPYLYDTAKEPLSSEGQIKAAITQLFYTTNWLHDYWYDSGFDEASGVAQNSNFGRVKDETGNVVTDGEGDAMEAQAQDKFFFGSRDNANMATPDDGSPPTMQMFVSKGRVLERAMTTTAADLPAAVFGNSLFGPKQFDVPSTAAVLVNDGGGPAPSTPTDGCQAITNDVSNKIAVIDAGNCTAPVKALNAQTAGARAVVIVDDSLTRGPVDFGGFAAAPVNIPVVRLTNADGVKLKAALAAPVQITLKRSAEIDADGTIDNGTIAHEWGHYWHHRLVSCGATQCAAMSEGFGDFIALHMIVRPGDDMAGSFNAGDYGDRAFDGAAYFGVRRYPYSTNFAKNPLTFKHVANKNALPPVADVPYNPRWLDEGVPGLPNAEVHSAGELWAVTLFEAYVGLLSAHPFDDAKRRMANYVVGGMKATPVEPSFTQQRDAILAYVYATDKADYEHFVAAFVKRGLGVGAKAPPLEGAEVDEAGDETFNEAEESFVRKGEISVESVNFDEAVRSCDGDGVVDADEVGELVLTIGNVGMLSVDDSTVEVTTAAAGVVFPGGSSRASSVKIDPYGRLVARVDVGFNADAAQKLDVTFNVKVKSATSFTAEVPATLRRRGNYDEARGASDIDTVNATKHGWAQADALDPEAPEWERQEGPADAALDYFWHGDDPSRRVDSTLESPNVVAGALPLRLEFDHRHSFEVTEADEKNPATYWDGGVIEVGEVTGSGGVAEWKDVEDVATASTGYNAPELGTDFGSTPEDDASENPLLGRPGFGGKSAGYDEGKWVAAKYDFGTAFAGKTVRFRFRLGSDAAAGAEGWSVDNVKVTGASAPPFTAINDDAGTCVGVPVAAAGNDQTVLVGEKVTLDASTSTDPDGNPLTFTWEQLDGPEVALESGEPAKPTFTAPGEETALVFRVRASDGKGFSTDTVNIRVVSQPGTGGSSGMGGSGGTGGNPGNGGKAGSVTIPGNPDDGCDCSTVGSNTTRGAWLTALAAGLGLVRRRRRQA